MKSTEPLPSINGTIEELASFFRVSVRTVQAWKNATPPVITYWQIGRNVMFPEESVIELKVKRSRYSRAMKPGEAQDVARREWREHLKLCRADQLAYQIADLQNRLSVLEGDNDQRGQPRKPNSKNAYDS
jgi:phage terminase Nu1 subunit (DNA packaging protein)